MEILDLMAALCLKLSDRSDDLDIVRTITLPYRNRIAPESVAADGPVPCAFKPFAESSIFDMGRNPVNLVIAFMIEELLIDERSSMRMVRTNLVLFIEKGNVKKRKTAEVSPNTRKEMRKIRQEAAVTEEKDLISQEEAETFGQIMKEWWEF